MITYEWSFPSFDVIKSENGLVDIVKTINWVYTAKEEPYKVSNYGQIFLGPVDPNRFIPFNRITKEWTIAVVSEQLDVKAMQLILSKEIENQKNPPVVSMAPPF